MPVHRKNRSQSDRPARHAALPVVPAAALPARSGPETVDPGWLLRMALAVLALAVACAYITVCVAFWKTQWQLVLHPSRTIDQTPAALSLRFEDVRFSPGSDGQPQLKGWWIPADSAGAPTALLLHGGDGAMDHDLRLAGVLHNARLAVLLFDYRGFGASTGPHPTQFLMEQDAEAALAFLHEGRREPLNAILPVGAGMGASLAVRLAAAHRELPAVILSSPSGDFEQEAKLATRSHMVPFSLLFHERFPLAEPLHRLTTPKLILSESKGKPSVIAQRAADPKMTVEGLGSGGTALEASVRRFLDSYLPLAPDDLRPPATPQR